MFSYGPLQRIYEASKQVLDALAAGRVPDHAALAEAVMAVEVAAGEREAYADEIAAARDQYVTDDLEIDDKPLICAAEKGVWVGAYVWVSNADEEETD